jgi:hypothetical protein
MIGNGLASRAVITKGNLSLLTSFDHAGVKLTIRDENQKVCKGERTGLWAENQFH